MKRSSLGTALRRNRFFALIQTDEVVTLRMALTRRVDGRTVVIGRATVRHEAPGETVRFRVRPTSAGRRALRDERRVALTLLVEAKDGAGNVKSTRARRKFER